MSRPTWIWTPVAVVVLALASYVLYVALRPPAQPPGILYGNGHIEGTEVTVSAEVAGRVVESHMEEGRKVAAGDLLVRLDDADLKVRLAQAQAERDAVEGERTRIGEDLKTWRHHQATAEADLARFRKLRAEGSATPRQLGAVEDRAREARGRVLALEAQVAETKARREAAARQVERLQLLLEKTEIRAPVGGTVLVKGIEAGELAQPGRQVATLVDLARVDLKVYIPERELGKVQLGDPARVRVDAFPDRHFDAAVAAVDPEAQFTPRDVHMPDERVRMVFGVKLALENPEGRLKPGMPADAWIRWDGARPWPERLLVPR